MHDVIKKMIRAFTICLLCLLIQSGCWSRGRQSLEGTVSLDGAPLAEGNITFRPQQGTKGPTAGGKIKDGKFSISSDQGTFNGAFRVEITASRKTNKMMKDNLTGELVFEIEQYLPSRYNKQSELTAEVVAGRPNHYEFALSSQYKP